MSDHQPEEKYVTEEVLDLKLKALVSQMTTRMVIAIAVGAGVSNAQLPTAVTVGAIGVAVSLPVIKGLLAFIGVR